jgi:O-antigen ligase
MTAMSHRSLEEPALKGNVCARLPPLADGLAAAVAVSLPWSTSASGILIFLWLVALLPTLDVAAVRREVFSAAGGLPVLLWVLGAIGMLWADVSWSERIAGMSSFHKLLVVPLLLAQFRRGGNVKWVLFGFLGSAGVLLAVSWFLVLAPGLTWRGKELGVPVKNYILQSEVFAICTFGLIARALELMRGAWQRLLLMLAPAVLFVADIGYVATSRTTLVVMAVLLLLLGVRQFGWKGALAAAVVGGVLAGVVWTSSPYLRERVTRAFAEAESYDPSHFHTSVGLRLEYWRKSLEFVAAAPVIGHGTGTVAKLFQRAATADTIPDAITGNPHSQMLNVALQLGIVGALVLVAMWIAHLALFRGGTLLAWLGLVVVVDNIVSSFFNSHLFDFTQGWLYVFSVGVIGGAVLRQAPRHTERSRQAAASRRGTVEDARAGDLA